MKPGYAIIGLILVVILLASGTQNKLPNEPINATNITAVTEMASQTLSTAVPAEQTVVVTTQKASNHEVRLFRDGSWYLTIAVVLGVLVAIGYFVYINWVGAIHSELITLDNSLIGTTEFKQVLIQLYWIKDLSLGGWFLRLGLGKGQSEERVKGTFTRWVIDQVPEGTSSEKTVTLLQQMCNRIVPGQIETPRTGIIVIGADYIKANLSELVERIRTIIEDAKAKGEAAGIQAQAMAKAATTMARQISEGLGVTSEQALRFVNSWVWSQGGATPLVNIGEKGV